MNAELEQIRDTWQEKTRVKNAVVMPAVGAAKLAEAQGRSTEAAEHWQAVQTHGFNAGDDREPQGGTEGDLDRLAHELATAYVEAHPGDFHYLEHMSAADCVALLETYRNIGNDTKEWETQAWLWHHFERPLIGGSGDRIRVRR